MYENFLANDEDLSPLLKGEDPALRHAGGPGRLLRVHERHCLRAARDPDFPPVGPLLMRRMADARTMRLAVAGLRRNGRTAPGPGGLRLDELDDRAAWSLARTLAAKVRAGTHRPGPVEVRQIPKEGRPGEYRELTIQTTPDRVVGRAAKMILEPVVDRAFSPFSFGCRPRRGPLDALATAAALAEGAGAWCFAAADIERAFDRIPHGPLLDACRRHFPDDVVGFIRLVACKAGKGGVRTGSPDSPLYANVFFDAKVDWPWHRRHPGLPLLRYVDDLLVLCRTPCQAAAALADLERLARSAGTPLKAKSMVAGDLSAGGSLPWLGYVLRREDDRLAPRIGETAWDRLGWRLAKAHLRDDAPVRAAQIVTNWVVAMGPCYPFEDRKAVLRRVRETAGELAAPGPAATSVSAVTSAGLPDTVSEGSLR
jgi:hypothetical protein